MTWPIGMGKLFKGVYHLQQDRVYLFEPGKGAVIQKPTIVEGINNPQLKTPSAALLLKSFENSWISLRAPVMNMTMKPFWRVSLLRSISVLR